MTSYEAIAIRIENARNSFLESLRDQFGLSDTDAEKVFNVYKKARVIKLDAAIGRYNLVHGAYWEANAIHNALAVQL